MKVEAPGHSELNECEAMICSLAGGFHNKLDVFTVWHGDAGMGRVGTHGDPIGRVSLSVTERSECPVVNGCGTKAIVSQGDGNVHTGLRFTGSTNGDLLHKVLCRTIVSDPVFWNR